MAVREGRERRANSPSEASAELTALRGMSVVRRRGGGRRQCAKSGPADGKANGVFISWSGLPGLHGGGCRDRTDGHRSLEVRQNPGVGGGRSKDRTDGHRSLASLKASQPSRKLSGCPDGLSTAT